MVYFMINWVLGVLGLLGISVLVPGFRVIEFASALIAAGIVGLLSAAIGAPFKHVNGRAAAAFLAGLTLVNTVVFRLSGLLIPGFTMRGFLPALAGGIVLLAVNLLTLHYSWALREDFEWEGLPAKRAEPTRNLVSSNR